MKKSALLRIAFISLFAGCGDNLDPVFLVKDLRVLAVKAQTPEVLYDVQAPVLTDAPQTTDLQFEALVVDPTRKPVSFTWQFCPVESNKACLDYQQKRNATPVENRRLLDQFHGQVQRGSALPVASSNNAVSNYDIAPFTFSAPEEFELLYRFPTLYGAGRGVWPSAILTAQNGGREEMAAKRVVVNVADVAQMAPELQEFFDLAICTGSTQDDAACLAVQPRTANRNPVFEKILYADGKKLPAHFIDVVEPIELRVKDEIRILPLFAADSEEAYQEFRIDLQTQDIEVVDRQEEISVTWFATAGGFTNNLTWVKFTKSLDTVYEAPADVPNETDGLVTLWMVARDQRGGTEWATLQLHILP